MARNLVSAAVSLVLLAATLWFANLAVFHAWAGSLPEARNLSEEAREWHLHWSNVFFGLALFSFFSLIGYSVWKAVRHWRGKRL